MCSTGIHYHFPRLKRNNGILHFKSMFIPFDKFPLHYCLLKMINSWRGNGLAKAFRRNCQYTEMVWCSKKIMCQTFSFIQRVGKHGVSVPFSNRKQNTWHKTVSSLPSDEMTVPRQTRERLMLPPSFSLSPSAPVRLARSLYDRIVTEICFNCFIKNKEYKSSNFNCQCCHNPSWNFQLYGLTITGHCQQCPWEIGST